MKGGILIAICMLFALSAYAAGVHDTYWGMNSTALMQKKEVTKKSNNEYTQPFRILGEATEISYIFKKDQLKAIGYDISYSPERLAKLQAKLTNKYGEPKEIFRGYLFEKEKNKEDYEKLKKEMKAELPQQTFASLAYEDVSGYYEGKRSAIGVIQYQMSDNKSDNSPDAPLKFLHFQDTRTEIYVYADVFPLADRIIVLYTETVEDFF